MKNTATVTWVKYPNFGTYLQAYALQQVIIGLGYTNSILDDSGVVEEGRKQRVRPSLPKRLKGRILSVLWGMLFDKHIALCRKSAACFHTFRSKYLQIDTSTFPLFELDKRYDAFICGSDQIWFPSENIFSPYYYLSFTHKKKIAYAPSLGASVYPGKFVGKVKPLLESFAAISVREAKGAELLATFMNRKVEVVLDPTLLLERKDWEQILNVDTQTFPEGKYIYCYFLSYNKTYMDYVKRFARKVNLPIVCLALQNRTLMIGDNIVPGGPNEFLSAIRNAAYVFTDSFHGTIFSLQFEKSFCTFKRFKNTDSNSQNSRVINLLRQVELEGRFIGEEQLAEIERLPVIDYAYVHECLQERRSHSLSYLKEALSD